MSALERIWATPFDYKLKGGTYCDASDMPLAPNKDAWCYARADLLTAAQAEIARLTVERDAAMAGRVKVKQLAWQTSGLKSDRAACYAYGLHGYGYEIFHDGAWFSLRGPDGRLGGALPSPDAAKAAAQADYEARILAAIQPDTVHQPLDGQLRAINDISEDPLK